MKSGFNTIAGRMEWAVQKFINGDLNGDICGLLDQVERCFPHWETGAILKYTARYLVVAGDNETAAAILAARGTK